MKNTCNLILALLMASPFSVVAEGFRMDMSLMDVIKEYNALSIGSLAVGEKGLVSIYGLKICVDKGALKVASISELDSSPSKYSYTFEVTRNPNDNVTVVFSRKGKMPDAEAVKEAVLRIVSTSDCEEIKKERIPLLSVATFLGANSLKDLVSQTNSAVAVTQSERKREFKSSNSKTTEILTNWIVSESKSAIDDSPTITMIKVAESGDQTLILRCKENSTDAYIRTDDFLGEDSINVTVRYDSSKAQKTKFSLSTDNKALFFSPAIASIKKMMASKNMIIRYHTYSGTPNTVSFNISDLKSEIKPLREACHW